MIRVGVLGAAGRMGRLVCRAVSEDPDHSAASRDAADVTPGKRPTRRGAD